MSATADHIATHWPDHADHNTGRNIPSFDRSAGYLCGCGEHLGWPVQDEPPEADEFEPDEVHTTFQRPASAAGAAAWDKAAAPIQKALKGAYGTWGGQTEEFPLPDEPEIEEAVVVIEDGDGEDVGYTPMPAERVDAEGMSYGPPEDAEVVSDDDPPAPGDTFLEQLAREHADGPVADEAQTYSTDAALMRPCRVMVPDGPESMIECGNECEQGSEQCGWHAGQADPYDTPAAVEGREYDATKDAEWRRVQDQSDADDPATHVTPDGMVYTEETTDTPYGKFDAEPDTFLGGLPEDHDAVFGKPESTVDQESAGQTEQLDPKPVHPEDLPALSEEDYQALSTADKARWQRAFDAEQERNARAEIARRTPPEPGSGTPILPVEGDMDDPVSSSLPGPIDPTEVYTPHDVELAIVDILGRLDRGERFLRQQVARLHLADYNLLMKYSAAIAASEERAADQRKAVATLACAKETYEQSEAAMLVRALRDTLHNLRSQLMGMQTVSKSIGVSVNAPSYRP